MACPAAPSVSPGRRVRGGRHCRGQPGTIHARGGLMWLRAALRADSPRRPLQVAALSALLLLVTCLSPEAQLKKVDVGQLLLIYFDPTETYLVPHTVQSLFTSLDFQRRTFGFDPNSKVVVLLADFSDSADAGASVTPRDRLSIQIAPLGYAFETIAANDRLI